MSVEEKQSLEKGYRIFNYVDWHVVRGDASESFGLTFGLGDKAAAVQASRYLKGIVRMDWLMVAEVDDGVLQQSKGRYPDYTNYKGGTLDSHYVPELCASEIDITDGRWHDVVYYYCTAIDPKKQTVILGGNSFITDKQRSALQFANRYADYNRRRLMSELPFEIFLNYKKGHF